MVRQTALRIVIGADTLGTVSRAHLAAAFRRNFRIVLGLFLRQQTAAQHLERLVLILVLASLVLTFHDHPRGQMRDADR